MILMRYMAFVLAVLFTTATFALPVEAAATKSEKKTTKSAPAHKVQTSSSKKQSVKKSNKKSTLASSTSTSHKKAQARDKSKNKSHKNTSKKSKKAANSSADMGMSLAASQTDSQQIWLERAAKSELQTGVASWYGSKAHGGGTASGESYDMHMYTAAHRTLPLGTVVKVTDEKSGDSVMVCINDRGPFVRGRVIDLSYAAAEQIGLRGRGVTSVAVEVVSNAEGHPINADDAFYVNLRGEDATPKDIVGPFRQFADASVMQEVLRTQHPKAAIVVRHVASR